MFSLLRARSFVCQFTYRARREPPLASPATSEPLLSANRLRTLNCFSVSFIDTSLPGRLDRARSGPIARRSRTPTEDFVVSSNRAGGITPKSDVGHSDQSFDMCGKEPVFLVASS